MKAYTAERLAERALRMSDDLNDMVRDVQANEPDDEVVRLRQAIGRVMWAIYYEILQPTLDEHPSIGPEVAAEAVPAANLGPDPRAKRSTDPPAQPSACGSRRPRRRRTEQRGSPPHGQAHSQQSPGCGRPATGPTRTERQP